MFCHDQPYCIGIRCARMTSASAICPCNWSYSGLTSLPYTVPWNGISKISMGVHYIHLIHNKHWRPLMKFWLTLWVASCSLSAARDAWQSSWKRFLIPLRRRLPCQSLVLCLTQAPVARAMTRAPIHGPQSEENHDTIFEVTVSTMLGNCGLTDHHKWMAIICTADKTELGNNRLWGYEHMHNDPQQYAFTIFV